MKPAPDDVRAWATGFKSEVSDWANWVAAFIEKVSNPFPNSMDKKLSAHIALAEFLARGLASNGSGGLWEENAGVEAIEAINELRESALTAQGISGADYFSVFATALNSKEVRNPVRPDPRVMIWGTLEARVQSADLVILAGLNEGVWPEQPTPDPWLNRAMRSDVGLSSPDRRIGLSAHDFQQAIASRHVVLSRSTKDDDAATVPSRWLNRILNLTEGLPAQRGKEAVDAMRMRGQIWVEMAKSIDHRAPVRPAVLRPAPKPPLDARPRELTVTEIKTLLRDPYAIYARRVLRLRKINSLDCKPDHALRGTVLHAVVERFLSDRVDVFAPDAKDQLLKIARRTLSELVIWPETQQLWYARIVAIAEGFLKNEKLRRSVGTPFPPEQSGKLELAAERFVLRGKADRIDLLNDGQLAIYDYKSGQVPSPKQVRLFDRQLSLEAIMAEEGCFSDVPKAPVARVGYISLSPSHHDKNYDVRGTELSPEATLHEFKALIQAFDQRERGYTSRRAVPEMSFEGDFDQLARFGEWDESDPPSPEEVG